MALATQPLDAVTVTVGGTSGTDLSVESGGTLTFSTSNWDTAQSVTVAAAQDADGADGQRHPDPHRFAGGDYGSVTRSTCPVTMTGTTTRGLVLSESHAVGDGGLGQASYTVKLAAATLRLR